MCVPVILPGAILSKSEEINGPEQEIKGVRDMDVSLVYLPC